jgi:carboxyl-terminal processing protease
VLPDVLNYSLQIGETNLDNPLPWDTIQPANYEKFNLVQAYLAELHQRSEARTLTNQDFAYVGRDIAQYKKSQAEPTTTLNERDAIKERERATRENAARDKERENRPLPGVKVYELTVQDATAPGLPAPVGSTNDLSSATNSLKSAEAQKTPPPFDPVLDESERILEDYISLLPKSANLTVNP